MNPNLESAYVDEAMATYRARRPDAIPSAALQLLSTVFISVAIYLILTYLPVWPEYTKRAIWEAIVFLTPSRMIYAVDHLPSKLWGSVVDRGEVTKFRRADFGNRHAKSEALRRMLHLNGPRSFLPAIGRARAISGLSNIFNNGSSDMPAGLGNWDNSCYQNSVIQGLASLSTLKAFVDENLKRFGSDEEMRTHLALQSIAEQLNNTYNNGRSMWTPPALKSMSSWQQQDAQEYFSKIMDELEKEVLQGSNAVRMKDDIARSIWTNEGRQTLVAVPPSVTTGKSTNDHHILQRVLHTWDRKSNPIEGLLAQRVGCMKCGFTEGLSLIPFTFLTVPLGRDFESDLRDCLDEYTNCEPIEGVECSQCSVLHLQQQLKHLIGPSDRDQARQGDSPGPSPFMVAAQARLKDIDKVLEDGDYSDNALAKTLRVTQRNRISSTKSRQAVIARAPQSLVLHVNRSVFDETTGAQYKNTASVRFPLRLDLSEWCLGTLSTTETGEAVENWETDPSRSMLSLNPSNASRSKVYQLSAVITHQGRHENGHYVAYRKRPWQPPVASDEDSDNVELKHGDYQDRWFSFSDEAVSMVSEGQVLAQGGVFMLFYEAISADSGPQPGVVTQDHKIVADSHSPRKDTEYDDPNAERTDKTPSHAEGTYAERVDDSCVNVSLKTPEEASFTAVGSQVSSTSSNEEDESQYERQSSTSSREETPATEALDCTLQHDDESYFKPLDNIPTPSPPKQPATKEQSSEGPFIEDQHTIPNT